MPSEVSMSGANQVRRRTHEELERELAEAREQQAATAQILAAISNSPTDPNRVFAEIAASAARLCDAHNSGILQLAGDHLRLLARYGPLVGPAPVGQASVPFTRGAVIGRAIMEKQSIHVADLNGCPIGAIAVTRSLVGRFPPRQIELLQTFADQAVIAIENARL